MTKKQIALLKVRTAMRFRGLVVEPAKPTQAEQEASNKPLVGTYYSDLMTLEYIEGFPMRLTAKGLKEIKDL